jgi:hypothetical protein
MLIEVSERSYQRAIKEEPGWFYEALTTIAFSALAIEALCNSIGKRKIQDWEDFESSSPNAKLRLLAKTLLIEYKKSDEPWITARWLFKFRNQVAHAKPEFIKEESIITQKQFQEREFNRPQSRLEKEINLRNAKKALDAAKNIKDILCDRIPPDEAFGLFADGWSGKTEAIEDDQA